MKRAVDGLILKESVSGDNDKLIWVLTARDGRLSMTAKGARSVRSRVASVCRLFTYGNFEYYERNDRRWVSAGSVNESFFGLCSELEAFTLASYLSEIAFEITGEGVEAEEILRMTLNSLYCLENKKKPHWQIKATYELFAARESGMSPDLSGCCTCGCDEGSAFWLDVMNGAILCEKCMKKRGMGAPIPEYDELSTRNILLPISGSTLGAMRYIMSAPVSRIFAFTVKDENCADELCRVAESYLVNHLERNFDTLDFYKKVST